MDDAQRQALLEALQKDLRETLAENVRAARKLAGYSQQTLGALAGVDQATISRVENSGNGVTLDNLASIAFACGTVAHKLLIRQVEAWNPPEGTPSAGQEGRGSPARRVVTEPSGSNETEAAKPKRGSIGGHAHRPPAAKRKNRRTK